MKSELPKVWDSYERTDFISLLNEGASWAVIAPHPDDELIMAYGFMRSWPKTGRIIVVTNGAAGVEVGFESLDASTLVSTRYGETLRVATELGIDLNQVVFLGKEDGGADKDLVGSWEASIKGAIHSCKPDLVIAPHPLELHPDHRKVGRIVQKIPGNFLRLFTCWPRGLSLGIATYNLRLYKNEWINKQNVAKTYVTQPFVSKRLTDPFYSVERFWTKEQLPSLECQIKDGFTTVHPRTSLLMNAHFRYLIDSSVAKRKRVSAAIDAKVSLAGTDPWNFKTSEAEQKRINCTVDMTIALEPKHVVDCGCGNGEMLRVLASKWGGYSTGIESNAEMAKAAENSLSSKVTIVHGGFIHKVSAISELDTLILTEICYYIHPVEWVSFCTNYAIRASKVVFSMRPASEAMAYIIPFLQGFVIVDVNIVCRDKEPQEDGWIILSLQRNHNAQLNQTPKDLPIPE